MKKLLIFFFVAAMILVQSNPIQAQGKKPFRMGFQLQELQESFGLGLNFTVPLPSNWPSLRVAGNWHWLEVPSEGEAQLTHFQTIRLGTAPNGWQVAEKISVYGEGGVLLLVADNDLSKNAVTPGGYGLFGFEFFTNKIGGSSLYVEMGAASTGQRVQRPDGIPRFGAGFMLGAGFRVALGK